MKFVDDYDNDDDDVEWRGVALSPTVCRLAVYLGPFRQHQSNDRL